PTRRSSDLDRAIGLPDEARARHPKSQSPHRNVDLPVPAVQTPTEPERAQEILPRCDEDSCTIAELDLGVRRELQGEQDAIGRTCVVAVPDCVPIFPVRSVTLYAP